MKRSILNILVESAIVVQNIGALLFLLMFVIAGLDQKYDMAVFFAIASYLLKNAYTMVVHNKEDQPNPVRIEE